MKTDIHPKYQDVKFTCACGASFVAGSTIEKDFKTEICSKCHPFYTGKQKLIDTSGRVDKFMAKMKKAQELADKDVKKVDKGDEEAAAKETAKKEKKEKAPMLNITEEKAEEVIEEKAEEKKEVEKEKNEEETKEENPEEEAKTEKTTEEAKTPEEEAKKE